MATLKNHRVNFHFPMGFPMVFPLKPPFSYGITITSHFSLAGAAGAAGLARLAEGSFAQDPDAAQACDVHRVTLLEQ